jgi:N-carbamoyl-L-amino-acid hydrolase
MEVRKQRLRDDLLTNGDFGAIKTEDGHSRSVLTGSVADEQARSFFVERLEDAGMDVRVDSVGNIAGRWVPPGADPDAAPIAAGSHLDSVPEGGIFDGPLGVYAALEALRAMQDADLDLARPLEVVSFTEEEGHRFGIGLLGSSVVGGQRTAEEVLALEDETGTTLRTALTDMGFHGNDNIDAADWNAWFEVHVEQGTHLEQAGADIGIVTAITGLTNCAVEIVGAADHAGGTGMDERRDALVAASEIIQDLRRIVREIRTIDSASAVATVGEIEIEPNARNVVPGAARLSMDIRDVTRETMDEIVGLVRRSLARTADDYNVEANLDRYRTVAPVQMDDRCQQALADAAERLGTTNLKFPSGGGHDTMNVAAKTDVGMLFTPSEAGVSHSPREWTDWTDCARAAQVLAEAMADQAAAQK